MFPITIRFKIKIGPINQLESKLIIEEIISELQKLKVDKINYTDLEINFKNTYFNGQSRNHLMAIVEKGYFKINDTSNQIIYCFSMMRTFLITIVMSLIAEIFVQMMYIGIYAFCWLFGMNWIIAVIRHYLFAQRLEKMLNLAVKK